MRSVISLFVGSRRWLLAGALIITGLIGSTGAASAFYNPGSNTIDSAGDLQNLWYSDPVSHTTNWVDGTSAFDQSRYVYSLTDNQYGGATAEAWVWASFDSPQSITKQGAWDDSSGYGQAAVMTVGRQQEWDTIRT